MFHSAVPLSQPWHNSTICLHRGVSSQRAASSDAGNRVPKKPKASKGTSPKKPAKSPKKPKKSKKGKEAKTKTETPKEWIYLVFVGMMWHAWLLMAMPDLYLYSFSICVIWSNVKNSCWFTVGDALPCAWSSRIKVRDLKKLSRPLGTRDTCVGEKKEPVEANAQSWAISCVCVWISLFTHTHVVEHMWCCICQVTDLSWFLEVTRLH